jgi:hypothetical protein
VKACAIANAAAMSTNTIENVVQRLSSPDSGMLSHGFGGPHLHQLSQAYDFQEEQSLTLSVIDVKVKVEAATQLRDNLEHYISGPIYPSFLKKLIPIFLNCLKGPPVFISTSAEQVRSPVLICV